MRIHPTVLAASLVALLTALAPLAAAQSTMPGALAQPVQLHVDVGLFPADLGIDNTGLAADGLNAELRLPLPWSGQGSVDVDLPAGATLVRATCSCGVGGTAQGGKAHFPLNASTPRGTYTFTVATTQPWAGSAGGLTVRLPTSSGAIAAVVYTPTFLTSTSAWGVGSDALTTTDGKQAFRVYTPPSGLADPNPFWVAIHPASPLQANPVTPGGGLSPWLYAVGGLVLGILLWAFLVSRGAVQARSRRQVVATAAHEEAAKEPAPVLEGRKRALMAALKELEMARMSNEIDVAAYDTVKADLKRQTVTVMRALETAQGDAKP